MTLSKVQTNFLVIIGFAALSLLSIIFLQSSASAHSGGGYAKPPNIVETAVSINQSTGEFSTLIAAASCTDIAGRLSNNHRNFTLFAPTDAAFAKLSLNASNVCSSFDTATLTTILENHISRGEKSAECVLGRSSIRTLARERAPIVGATIAGQNIIQTDVQTRNGIIHVIDGVILL